MQSMELPVTNDSQHPFGDQATSQLRPALGFASQPCDWFAFIEDDDAAGPFLHGAKRSPNVDQAFESDD